VSGYVSLQVDALLFPWDFGEDFNNVQQGILFVMKEFCQGFAPLVNEK